MSTEIPIFTLVRDRVVNGEFSPNQRLKSADLGVEYAISASSMREILFRLSTIGLVNFQEQRGFRVPTQSDALLHDLTKFRILLEQEGAVLSIRNGDIDWESRLMAAHHKLSHLESRITDSPIDSPLLTLWTRAEQAFHQTLIDACDSPVLIETHDVVYHRFRQQMIAKDKNYRYVLQNVTEHQGILDAVLSKDEALARRLIHDHLARNFARND
jgi:DNA-binding GntR family transcriptional regulator